MKTSLIAAVIFLVTGIAASQEHVVTVEGSVVDSTNGERIPYATVSVVNTAVGVVADVNGYFILRNVKLPGTKLRASAIGYKPKDFDVAYNGQTVVIMRLLIPESPKTLPAVEVTGQVVGVPAGVVGNTIITSNELARGVGAFKNDAVQYVTQLPGVVTVSGVSSQYYVQGGGPDQNLVLVDGMQIYNISHAFGLFSFIDPLIVKVANFNTSGFQAQYGGRLSSVFDIQTIDGDKYNYTTSGNLDLLSSDFSLSGPLFEKGSSSFVLFYRRPLFEDAINRFYSLNLPTDFYDGFAKVSADLGEAGHISAEFLTTQDKIVQASPTDPDFRWGNNSGAISGGFLLGDQYDMKVSASMSTYKAEQFPKEANYLGHQLSQVTNPSLYADVTSYTSAQNQFEVGLLFSFPTYNYTFTNKFGSVIDQTSTEIEPQMWSKYTFHVVGKLSLELGLRADLERTFQALSSQQHGYLGEPRFTVIYGITDPVSFYASAGSYHQRLMDLNDENMVYTAFDVIAPVPEDNGDEQSTQYVVGCKLNPNILTSAKIEIYYKDFQDLVAVNRNKVYDWEDDFVYGSGKAYGVDASLKYDAGENLYVQLGYSFGSTNRTFDSLTYVPRYDLRHQLNASAGFMPIQNMWLRARWKITSGLPYTPVDGFFGLVQFDPKNLPGFTQQALYSQVLFGDLNTARMPGFQSLDVSATYELNFDWGHLDIEGTIVNLYNKRNVFYINNVTGDVVYQLPTFFNFSLGWHI